VLVSPPLVLSDPPLRCYVFGNGAEPSGLVQNVAGSSACRSQLLSDLLGDLGVYEEGWCPGPRSSSQLKNLGCPQPVVAGGKIKAVKYCPLRNKERENKEGGSKVKWESEWVGK
jgi:hypothetical protein